MSIVSDASALASHHVDEFLFHLTHDKIVDWLLPGVPPTGKKLTIPMLGVINIRGDRLYHGTHVGLFGSGPFFKLWYLEHIWWDQATCLLQAGLIPTHVPYKGRRQLRLPVAGEECARLLMDETDGKSNEMFGSNWGVKDN